jgi:hypothetical protein
MCLLDRVLVVGIYVHFWEEVGGRQSCPFQVGRKWLAVKCLSGRGLVVRSYVPFR